MLKRLKGPAMTKLANLREYLPLLLVLAILTFVTLNVYSQETNLGVGGEHPINRAAIMPGAGICLPF
jgi:hypothetical protein